VGFQELAAGLADALLGELQVHASSLALSSLKGNAFPLDSRFGVLGRFCLP
jgi:hypothetical protein